jgi:nitrite reductase (NADH) small subunit
MANQQETKEFFQVGPVGRFPVRVGVRVKLDRTEAAVFRLSDGRIYALENKNPNRKGGVLCEGMVSGEYLYDPLYDWKIHLPSGIVQAPDTGEVKTLTVKIENGVVHLAV